MDKNLLNDLSGEILDASIEVHRELGLGLLESFYEYCLFEELNLRRINVENQVQLPIYYKGKLLPKEFRIDILVEKEIIIEIKAVEVILPIHQAQIISYLRLANKSLGFLINFNVPLLKQGFKRVVNNF